MANLSCPHCGAAVYRAAVWCGYCGAPRAPGMPPPLGEPGPLPDLPADWVRYADEWSGFALGHPPGWEVRGTRGLITVREDAAGSTAAMIWPIRLPAPADVQTVAAQFVAWARAGNPSFEAWRVPEESPASNRILLRTRSQRQNVTLDGGVTITVDGLNAMISGFQAPAPSASARAPVMVQVLRSFRLIPPMPRRPYREPREGAFDALAPAGWIAQGQANRNHVGNAAICQFWANFDPQGFVQAVVPGQAWMFTDGWAGWLMGIPAGPTLKYLPAGAFASQWLAHHMQPQHPQLAVESVQDRPDLLPELYEDGAKVGLTPQNTEIAAACLTTTYTLGGMRMRQKTVVSTARGRGGMAMTGCMAGQWSALLNAYYRAPADEFAALEPILAGILSTYQVNPVWQQQELMRMNQLSAAIQQDAFRRQREISRTLSQTSDIIMSGYYERQKTYDHVSHQWSNAILGRTDVLDPSSSIVYSVPNDYDQYWRDNSGYFHGGSWLTRPDPSWQKLDPVRI